MTSLTTSTTCCILIWPSRSKRCPFSTRLPLMRHQIYLGKIQTSLNRPHDLSPSPTWRRIWIYCSSSRMWAPPLAGRPLFLKSTWILTKSAPRAVLQLHMRSEKDTETGSHHSSGSPYGRTNLNYTGSSTRVHSRGLQHASNGIIPWPVG
jgi:hypothetical protein